MSDAVGCTYVDLDGSDSEVDWGDDSVEVVVAPPPAIAECRSPRLLERSAEVLHHLLIFPCE